MSLAIEQPDSSLGSPPAGHPQAAVSFAPRVPPASWPATRRGRDEVLERMTSPPFVPHRTDGRSKRAMGVRLLLGWLGDQPGQDWQQRWLSSGADAAPAA